MRRSALFFFCLSMTPALAAAQGVLVETADGEVECRPFDTARTCNGATCLVSTDVCRDFGTVRYCVPSDALICRANTTDTCPAGSRPIDALGFPLCVELEATLCGGPVRPCFTKAGAPSGSAFPVAWIHGDCDADGLANGDELPDGVCALPPRIGVSTGAGCDTPTVCHDACTDGACVDVEGTGHRYCLPPADGFVFCCGGLDEIECPIGVGCQLAAGTDDFGFCDPFPYCPELDFASRLACLEGPGGFPVPPDDGDCDGDGASNVSEVDPRDPCVPEAPLDGAVPTIDGGPSPIDGGVSPILDAGIARDAGTSDLDAQVAPMDATTPDPTPLPPQFAGGGGCRCRAAPSKRSGGALVLFALVALGIARRRQGA